MGLTDLFEFSLERANQFYAWGWRLSVIGAVLTMVGIAALWLGTRVRDHDFESKISETTLAAEQLHKDNLTLQTNLESERIARLQLEGKTEGFRLDIAKANERAGALELEKDKQRERTAKAEKELLVMKESLKPRRLTLEQQTLLLEDLSKGERGEVHVHFVSGDAEVHNFAIDIFEVLKLSGWTASRKIGIGPTGRVSVGVHMIVQDPQTTRVLTLLSAFEHIGLAVPVKVNPAADPVVHLIIGSKP